MRLFSILTVLMVAAVFSGMVVPDRTLSRPPAEAQPGSAAPADALADSPASAQPVRARGTSATAVPKQELDEPAVEPARSPCVELPGLVVAADRAPVQAIVSGVLKELPVGCGGTVNTGGLVARIDDAELAAACKRQEAQINSAQDLVKEAEIQLRHAQYTYGKTQRLFEKKAGSEADLVEAEFAAQSAAVKLEAAKSQVTTEEQQLAVLQRQREKHRMVAPFTGTVTEILRYPHQYVGQGDIILWMESHRKHLKVHVPARLLQHLDLIRFSLSSDDRAPSLKVYARRPDSNLDGSRTVLLELPEGSGFLPGQIVGVLAKLPGGAR
jgi:RND family efflux transporter MFP subunit